MAEAQKKSLGERFLVPVLIALLAGGTAPWWYKEVKNVFNSKSLKAPKTLWSEKIRAASPAGDGDGHPRDGEIKAEEGWCLDTDSAKVQFVVDESENNNLPTEKLAKVKTISTKVMVFTVINNPAVRHKPSHTLARASISEYACE